MSCSICNGPFLDPIIWKGGTNPPLKCGSKRPRAPMGSGDKGQDMKMVVETAQEAYAVVVAARAFVLEAGWKKGHCTESCACNVCLTGRKLKDVLLYLAKEIGK